MANTEGGTVILGVSPRAGELVGIKDLEAAYERIFQAALLADPTLVLPIPRQVKYTKPGMLDPVDLIVDHRTGGFTACLLPGWQVSGKRRNSNQSIISPPVV